MEEDGIQGHVPRTIVSMLKIKNECIRVFLAEALCTFSMMVSVLSLNLNMLCNRTLLPKHIVIVVMPRFSVMLLLC